MSQGYYVKWNISILHIISYYANTVILWLPEITGIIQRETHSTDRVWVILQGKARHQGMGLSVLCCCCSHVRLFNHVDLGVQASLSFTMFQTLLKLVFTELMMLSSLIILSCLLLLLPSICTSIRVFSSKSALRIRWPKYCSFSFSISLSSEYSGSIFFRTDWFHFLAGQLFATLWTEDCQAPLSMGFSRQAYWSELPGPSPGNLLDRGIKPASLVSPPLGGGSLSLSPPGKISCCPREFQQSSLAPQFERINSLGLSLHSLMATLVKEITCQWRRHGFHSWVIKIPWRRKWQPTPVSCLENLMHREA